MTKRAASAKPAPKKIADERTPEEYFEEAKLGLITIAESYKKNASRPDHVLDVLDNVYSYYSTNNENLNSSLNLTCAIIELRKEYLDKIIDKLNTITFEQMTAEEWEDPFSDWLTSVIYIDTTAPDDLVMSWLLKANCIFNCVRPFGEKLEKLRITLMEMKDK